ncbi:hypothetical protein [Martelella sp. HB161492]|uniref:hypothetical protein n=1 Tax=Martelella sp. HB161492 TaxID=2720726 RepID=UPI001590961C|nr:hypothetical protein [Martelella sp. HB161492]
MPLPEEANGTAGNAPSSYPSLQILLSDRPELFLKPGRLDFEDIRNLWCLNTESKLRYGRSLLAQAAPMYRREIAANWEAVTGDAQEFMRFFEEINALEAPTDDMRSRVLHGLAHWLPKLGHEKMSVAGLFGSRDIGLPKALKLELLGTVDLASLRDADKQAVLGMAVQGIREMLQMHPDLRLHPAVNATLNRLCQQIGSVPGEETIIADGIHGLCSLMASAYSDPENDDIPLALYSELMDAWLQVNTQQPAAQVPTFAAMLADIRRWPEDKRAKIYNKGVVWGISENEGGFEDEARMLLRDIHAMQNEAAWKEAAASFVTMIVERNTADDFADENMMRSLVRIFAEESLKTAPEQSERAFSVLLDELDSRTQVDLDDCDEMEDYVRDFDDSEDAGNDPEPFIFRPVLSDMLTDLVTAVEEAPVSAATLNRIADFLPVTDKGVDKLLSRNAFDGLVSAAGRRASGGGDADVTALFHKLFSMVPARERAFPASFERLFDSIMGHIGRTPSAQQQALLQVLDRALATARQKIAAQLQATDKQT